MAYVKTAYRNHESVSVKKAIKKTMMENFQVAQNQEIMTDEEMAGAMIDRKVNSYLPTENPTLLDNDSAIKKEVTFGETIEVCEFDERALMEEGKSEPLVESVKGRQTPFYFKLRRQRSKRYFRYLKRIIKNPCKPRYVHVRDTLKRVNT